MPDATIERITELYRHLRDADDLAFVQTLHGYLGALDSERRVRRILTNLHSQADAALSEFADRDRELTDELSDIRQRLETDAPEIRAAVDPPEPQDPIRRREWLLETLSGFDVAAAQEAEIGFAPLTYFAEASPGKAPQLLQILRGRLYLATWGNRCGRGPQPSAPQRNDLDDYEVEIGNVQERYSVANRRFQQQERTLAGLAHERLRLFDASLNPEPFLRNVNEDEAAFMERAFRRALEDMGERGMLRRAAEGQQLTQAEQRSFERLVGFLRGELERLHVEIVDRLRVEQASVRGRLTARVKGIPVWALTVAAATIVTAVTLAAAGYAWQWLVH